nr:hypothetical protein [uncultured Blautia sp.]
MQIISSYGVELRKQNIPIRQTLEIYRSAVSYLIGIYVQVWEELEKRSLFIRKLSSLNNAFQFYKSKNRTISSLLFQR